MKYGLNITGWWLTYPSEKYESVSWDDEIPNIFKSHKIHVPNHQQVRNNDNPACIKMVNHHAINR